MTYNLYPAVDENLDFVQDIRARLGMSLELRNQVVPMTTAVRDSLKPSELWDGRLIVNTDIDHIERYDLANTTWINVTDDSNLATIEYVDNHPWIFAQGNHYIGQGIDLDALVRTGFYEVGSPLNAPAGSDWVLVQVMGNGNDFVQQFLSYHTADPPMLWFRVRQVSVWQPWDKVLLDSQVNPPTTLPPSGPAGGDLAGSYPDPTLAVDRVKKTGDTMSGQLAVQQVLIGGASGSIAYLDAGNQGRLELANPTDKHVRLIAKDAAGQILFRPGNQGSKEFAISTSIVWSNVPIHLPADPTAALDAATKQYVDAKAAAGGISRVVQLISTSQTLAAVAKTDYVYICNAGLTATLPTAAGNTNFYTIKRSGAANVTVTPQSGQTIDGQTSFVLDVQWMAIDLISDGTNWVVV